MPVFPRTICHIPQQEGACLEVEVVTIGNIVVPVP